MGKCNCIVILQESCAHAKHAPWSSPGHSNIQSSLLHTIQDCIHGFEEDLGLAMLFDRHLELPKGPSMDRCKSFLVCLIPPL